MSSQIPFTVDHVGSFLRPETIKKARKKVQAGALSQAELRLIEDEEIKALVAKQKAGGLRESQMVNFVAVFGILIS
ncbi:methionine synthase [Enterococcus sp. DIV2467a]|nr:methionine synthase [Enterococcus faecalis]OSH16404.1 methionine synthase [Enterococcus faecalis]